MEIVNFETPEKKQEVPKRRFGVQNVSERPSGSLWLNLNTADNVRKSVQQKMGKSLSFMPIVIESISILFVKQAGTNLKNFFQAMAMLSQYMK